MSTNLTFIETAVYYLIVINFLAFAAFGYDKAQAENGGWRLRESTLASFALIGGFLGAFAGRTLFRHKTRKPSFSTQLWGSTLGCLVITGSGWFLISSRVLPPSLEEKARLDRVMASVHYAGCNQVRAAGKAPLHYGEPGYRSDMDGDGDGIACESHF